MKKKTVDILAFMLNSTEDFVEGAEKVKASQAFKHAPRIADLEHQAHEMLHRQQELSIRQTEAMVQNLENAVNSKMTPETLSEVTKAIKLNRKQLDLEIEKDRHNMNIRLEAKEKLHELERRLRQDNSGEKV